MALLEESDTLTVTVAVPHKDLYRNALRGIGMAPVTLGYRVDKSHVSKLCQNSNAALLTLLLSNRHI